MAMALSSYVLIAVLAWVVICVTVGLLWARRKTGSFFATVLAKPYRARESQEDRWRQRYQGGQFADADRVLKLLCDAFSFVPEQRFQLAPDDKLLEIYRSLYPRWKFWQAGDDMELESFLLNLDEEFGSVDLSVDSQTSLESIVDAVLKHRELSS